jgi:uncharacterized NAD(P)/FAD-binding protein YdhS
MTSDREFPVAIVGGGASGTILAAQLARRGIASALIDGSGRLGRGVAYSTAEPAHLLNVRADGMSAWAGESDHFARRFEAEGGTPRGFAQRRLFGRYLGEILNDAVATGLVEPVQATVLRARREEHGWRFDLDDGSTLIAAAAVLASGNQEPEGLRAFAGASERLIGNPWGAEARAAIEAVAATGDPVLLIGTGLTMVDLVLSLGAAGYGGKILAVSRRGLVPRSHADFEPAPAQQSELPGGNVRSIWRWLRRRSAEVGWRAAVDSLRPYSHSLWQGLSEREQRRFLRHARPWWDVHRHRIAPEVASTVAGMVADGRLEIMAGRIVAAHQTKCGVEVEIRRRGAPTKQTFNFAFAFNCTGPLHSMELTRDPLLRSLLDSGAARPDQLGLGLAVDETCRAGEHLWAMGPLTKGRYWEIIAVPDIREQAAEIAGHIQRELEQ